MSSLTEKFINKKKADSTFLTLSDGETVKVKKLKDIKLVVKTGFGGEEKEVIRLKCEVETSEGLRDKDFDNGTQRFAEEMQKFNVDVGDSFSITRNGQGTKTRYTISEVVKGGQAAPAAPAADAPAK